MNFESYLRFIGRTETSDALIDRAGHAIPLPWSCLSRELSSARAEHTVAIAVQSDGRAVRPRIWIISDPDFRAKTASIGLELGFD